MKTPHTGVYRGKRVKVILKDGYTFVDKFLEKDARRIYFENRTVPRGEVKSFVIIKGHQELSQVEKENK